MKSAPTNKPPMPISDWGSKVGVESRKSYAKKLESGFIQKYLSGKTVLDVGYKGYVADVMPIVPHAIGIDTDYPGYDGSSLPFENESVDCVHSSHCLEHISDPINALRDWHRVLKIGGFIIIAVPHRDLYEKRNFLPSKWNADHKRLYTPSSLLSEIEQALAPNSYRIRELYDNDSDYDYSIDPESHAGGCYEIEVVVEKLALPVWGLEQPSPLVTGDSALQRAITVQHRKARIQSICALKLDHIGDFATAIPAMIELRNKFPFAKIDLVCGSWNLDLARAVGIFNEIFIYDFFERNPTIPDGQNRQHNVFPSGILKQTYDLAIDLRVFVDTRPVLSRLLARWYAGIDIANLSTDRSIVFAAEAQSPRSQTLQFIDSSNFNPTPNEQRRYQNIGKHRVVFNVNAGMLEHGSYRVEILYRTKRRIVSRRPLVDVIAFYKEEIIARQRTRLGRLFDRPASLEFKISAQMPVVLRFAVRRGSFTWVECRGVLIHRLPELDQAPARTKRLHLADQLNLLVALVSSKLNEPDYGDAAKRLIASAPSGATQTSEQR